MPNIDPEIVRMLIQDMYELENAVTCLAEDIKQALGEFDDIDTMLERDSEINTLIADICDERMTDPELMKRVYNGLCNVGAFDD